MSQVYIVCYGNCSITEDHLIKIFPLPFKIVFYVDLRLHHFPSNNLDTNITGLGIAGGVVQIDTTTVFSFHWNFG